MVAAQRVTKTLTQQTDIRGDRRPRRGLRHKTTSDLVSGADFSIHRPDLEFSEFAKTL